MFRTRRKRVIYRYRMNMSSIWSNTIPQIVRLFICANNGEESLRWTCASEQRAFRKRKKKVDSAHQKPALLHVLPQSAISVPNTLFRALSRTQSVRQFVSRLPRSQRDVLELVKSLRMVSRVVSGSFYSPQ